jgi:hypothetical protein
MSPDTYAIAGLISSALANEHCSFFADKPSEAKSMFTQRFYRSLGLAAQLGWARLLIDRYCDVVEIPASIREGPGGCHPPTTRARSGTRTTIALTTLNNVAGGLCSDMCLSQLEPVPPSEGAHKKDLYFIHLVLEYAHPSGGGCKIYIYIYIYTHKRSSESSVPLEGKR